jgi:hypothetical protein
MHARRLNECGNGVTPVHIQQTINWMMMMMKVGINNSQWIMMMDDRQARRHHSH